MILCCGEALIDMIPVTQKDGTTAFVPHAGGAIFNTAIGLGRLGVKTGMLSGVSRDVFGTLLADTLVENGVATDLLIRSDRLTTLAIVHIREGSATYAFYDENSAGCGVQAADMPALPDSVSTLYFGGISLVAEPAADSYAALLDRSCQGRVVMIDPNIRPGFITDERAYRARLDRMMRQSDIIKVSDEDLEWLVGSDGTIIERAHALRAKGPRFVIVTMGGAGALAVGPQTVIEVPARSAVVVDTIGAGDTFNAGFLAGLDRAGVLSKSTLDQMEATDLASALALGAQVASITVSRAGANPPWASELID